MLLLAGIVTAIALQIDSGEPGHPGLPVRVIASDGTAVTAPAGSANQVNDWFKVVLARPLFSPDRRPIASGVQTVRGLPRLTGIIVTASQQVAVFASSAAGHATVVEAGAHVGLYEVKAISTTGVTVTGPDGTVVLRPMFDTTPASALRPPPLLRPDLPRLK